MQYIQCTASATVWMATLGDRSYEHRGPANTLRARAVNDGHVRPPRQARDPMICRFSQPLPETNRRLSQFIRICGMALAIILEAYRRERGLHETLSIVTGWRYRRPKWEYVFRQDTQGSRKPAARTRKRPNPVRVRPFAVFRKRWFSGLDLARHPETDEPDA